MYKIAVFSLIRSFSSKEFHLFHKWLHSPFHNNREDVQKLYACIQEILKDHPQNYWDKTVIWAMIYPDEVYNDAVFRQLTYLLRQQVEAFMVHQEQETEQNEYYLLRALRKRGLDKLFEKHYKKMQKRKPELQNDTYWRQQYEQELETLFLHQQQQTRTTELHLDQLLDSLDVQFFTAKLKYACSMLTYQRVYKTNYQTALIQEILSYLEGHQYLEIPAVGLYYHCYFFLQGGENAQAHFSTFFELLSKSEKIFPAREVKNFYLLAINYVIKHLNSGSKWHLEKAFELYQKGILGGFFIERGILSPWTFLNTIKSGLRLKKHAWIEQFIKDYVDFLPSKFHEALSQEAWARLYYAQKKYEQAINLLSQVDLKDSLQHLTAKMILAKIYYELDDLDKLENVLSSAKQYMHRKDIQPHYKRNYKNIIHLTQSLIKVNPYERTAKKRLEEEIKNTQPLTERAWLLEQVQNL